MTELLVQALVDLDQNWPKPRWKPATQLRRLVETMTEEEIENTKEELTGVGEDAGADIAQYEVSVAELAEVGKIDGGARIGDEPASADPEVSDSDESAE